MSEESESEQTTLNEMPEPQPDRTLQERILDRYKSPGLRSTAIGVWGKLLVESAIVVAPLTLVILLPGFVLAWLGIGPVTYWNTILVWATFSTSIIGIVWCFLNTVTTETEGDSPET